MFGPLEDMSFKDWWMKKGHELFSSSITTLQVTLFVRRKNAKIYSVSGNAFQDVSTRLAAQEFGFWLDQIFLLNAKEGLLSEAPLAWPIFKSRISYEVISQLLGIMEIHDQIIRNSPNTKLWQIGEQLGLNPQAITKNTDYPKEIEEKHRRMGQTVSSYLIKGKGLVDNAYKGYFPKYSVI